MLDLSSKRHTTACFISGSPEVGRCGIDDFSSTLGRALEREGVRVETIDQRDWSVRGVLALSRQIARMAPDVVQMQYPMIVGWRSLGPHATGFLNRTPQVLTLHEFSSFDRYRRASLRAFAVSASRIVLTTGFEASRFLARFPGAKKKTTVIPIGSNIPFKANAAVPRQGRKIVFFGQLKPLKGLEEFLDLARIAAQRSIAWDFQIVGAPVGWARNYLADMQRKTQDLRIDWLLDQTDEEAANILSRASAAYLAYPDGVSERRGSLIAALGNGAPVVTTTGKFQPDDMADLVLIAANPREAFVALEALFANPALEQRLREAGPAYVTRFDWARIATSYANIYLAATAFSAPPVSLR